METNQDEKRNRAVKALRAKIARLEKRLAAIEQTNSKSAEVVELPALPLRVGRVA
jgi:hypothetical protein